MNPPDSGPITKEVLLLGEGKDEVNFFSAFLKHLNLEHIQVDQFLGKRKIRTGLEAMTKRSGFNIVRRIAVTRDCDYPDDPSLSGTQAEESAFASVCDALKHAGLSVPQAQGQLSAGQPDVIVKIIPGRGRLGMLEDVCLESAQSNAPFACVDLYFKCLESNGVVKHPPNKASKAKVHAWLTSKEEPDLVLGEAAAKGYWDFEQSAFDDIRNFLKAL